MKKNHEDIKLIPSANYIKKLEKIREQQLHSFKKEIQKLIHSQYQGSDPSSSICVHGYTYGELNKEEKKEILSWLKKYGYELATYGSGDCIFIHPLTDSQS